MTTSSSEEKCRSKSMGDGVCYCIPPCSPAPRVEDWENEKLDLYHEGEGGFLRHNNDCRPMSKDDVREIVSVALTSQQDQIEVRMKEKIEKVYEHISYNDREQEENADPVVQEFKQNLLQALPTIIRNQEGRK